jgi:hypothetical protein
MLQRVSQLYDRFLLDNLLSRFANHIQVGRFVIVVAGLEHEVILIAHGLSVIKLQNSLQVLLQESFIFELKVDYVSFL